MPRKAQEGTPLRHIISFRVTDQELQTLKRLGGKTTRLSNVLRRLVKQICNNSSVDHQMLSARHVCKG